MSKNAFLFPKIKFKKERKKQAGFQQLPVAAAAAEGWK